MLLNFLTDQRDPIIDLFREKIRTVGQKKATSSEMERGLPLFFDEIIEVLSREAATNINSTEPGISDSRKSRVAGKRGKEFLRLGYTISQVVPCTS